MNINYQGNLVRITSFWKTKTRGLITHSNRGNDNSYGVYLEIGIVNIQFEYHFYRRLNYLLLL